MKLTLILIKQPCPCCHGSKQLGPYRCGWCHGVGYETVLRWRETA